VEDEIEWPDELDQFFQCDDLQTSDWQSPLPRIPGLTMDSLASALEEHEVEGDLAARLAWAEAQASPDPLDQLTWLQLPLLNWEWWGDSDSEYFHEDFVACADRICKIAEDLSALPEEGTRVVKGLMTFPGIWLYPVGPAAVLAYCSVSPDAVDQILKQFCDGNGEPGAECALIAVTCLHRNADVALVERALVDVQSASDQFLNEFLNYVYLFLADRGHRDECPDDTWRALFEFDALPRGLPTAGPTQLGILQHWIGMHLQEFTSRTSDDIVDRAMHIVASRQAAAP
jgi:hypothetical protein